MISANFTRTGLLVGNAVLELLSQEAYQVTFRKLIAEFQSVPAGTPQMYFQYGRSKVNGTFPNIGLEIQTRRDTWAATNSTKDLEFAYDITVAVKVLGLSDPTIVGEQHPIEQYIITLAEFVYEILNEPGAALQYTITKDQDGVDLAMPLRVYDSWASDIQYGFLYNGALRTAKIPWSGKLMRLGPSGTPVQGY